MTYLCTHITHLNYPSSHRVINIISRSPITGRGLVIGSGSLAVHCRHLAAKKQRQVKYPGMGLYPRKNRVLMQLSSTTGNVSLSHCERTSSYTQNRIQSLLVLVVPCIWVAVVLMSMFKSLSTVLHPVNQPTNNLWSWVLLEKLIFM
jgi:hypothetical protein